MSAAAEEPTSLVETYEAWTVRCQYADTAQGRRRICQMSQELRQQQTRQRLLLFALSSNDADSGVTKTTVVAPFGLLLAKGLTVKVGEEVMASGQFKTCLPVGCIVEIGLAGSAIERLIAGDKASILTVASSGQPLRTDISLHGFSAAYQRLTALAGK